MCFVLTDLLKAACFVLILANLGKVISVCSVMASPYLITVLTLIIQQLQLSWRRVIKLIENVMPVS